MSKTFPGRTGRHPARRSRFAKCAAIAVILALATLGALGATQSVILSAGWNAVYLEVDPADPSPAGVFAGLPVDAVAAFEAELDGAQFIRNPGVDLSQARGWAVWYAPRRADAFLSTLYEIQGAKPYLIHATTNATLVVAGDAPPAILKWQPDAFNFVGFPVQAVGAPTFAQYFGASPAHSHNRIYRLAGGKWRQVLNPGTETMRAGEAFWIFCDGTSDYTGPLEVTAPSPFGLALSQRGGSELVVRNRAAHPIAFRIEHAADPQAPVPLSMDIDVFDQEAGMMRKLTRHFPAGDWEQQLPALEPDEAIRLPLKLRAQDMAPGERRSLVTVLTDMGTKTVVPVTATRDDIP